MVWKRHSSVFHCGVLPLLLSAWLRACAAACSFRVIQDLRISPITAFQSPQGKLFLMDRSDVRNSRWTLPSGETIHAVEYDIGRNTVRPMATATNTWCSAGGYLPDGTLVNTGGNDVGVKSIRVLRPCGIGNTNPNPPVPCNEWWENPDILVCNETRWYPGSAMLPTGDIFLLGGSGTGGVPSIPNWELVQPFKKRSNPTTFIQLLQDAVPNDLYPFVHLLPYDMLFIFANTKGIIYDYKRNRIVANIPEIPDKKPRQYTSTGSSVLLPLSYKENFQKAEVLICGGSDPFPDITTRATRNCYRMDVSQRLLPTGLSWQGLEQLARPRVMPDMVYLLDGTVAIINGMQKGFASFGTSSTANRSPEIYTPTAAYGKRINSKLGCTSKVTRSYHAEATLVPDGRVLITGGNLVDGYDERFSTYSLEEWRPPYFYSRIPRPSNLKLISGLVEYRKVFTVTFRYPTVLPKGAVNPSNATVAGALISPAVTTHSNSYNLRYVNLARQSLRGARGAFTASFLAPPNAAIAPRGYYMFTLTHNQLPATSAIWVKLQ